MVVFCGVPTEVLKPNALTDLWLLLVKQFLKDQMPQPHAHLFTSHLVLYNAGTVRTPFRLTRIVRINRPHQDSPAWGSQAGGYPDSSSSFTKSRICPPRGPPMGADMNWQPLEHFRELRHGGIDGLHVRHRNCWFRS